MKSLVIHPKDSSTDFLIPIYQNIPDKTVITGKKTINEVNELIKSHDRIIMLGHGCPYGLFSIGLFPNSRGLVIDNYTVPLLKEKTDNIYVWCNADKFVLTHGLKGFYSGMFISEVGEAYYCGLNKIKQTTVDESNNQFSEILSKYANENSSVIYESVRKEYGDLSLNNPVANYNNERLYVS